MIDRKHELLNKYFGFSSFRENQEAIIDSILEGNDTLAILPTSAGKSICFQIPALAFSGVTIVISPLISLMKDQIENLEKKNIKAVQLNSSLKPSEYKTSINYIINGDCKILYVAPEGLWKESIVNISQKREISLIVVDEAHCISTWGYDFRPDYLEIKTFIDLLKNRPVIAAFTATATKYVENDIIKELKMKNNVNIIKGEIERKNLYLKAFHSPNRMDTLVEILKSKKDEPGIIYCITRKDTEKYSWAINKEFGALTSTFYHGGLNSTIRTQNQELFLRGMVKIMVATNAFGMGIDKDDISFIINYQMPMDIETYYQEVGRAGRNGRKAECILLYNEKDVKTNEFLITVSNKDTDENINFINQEYQKHKLNLLYKMEEFATTKNCLGNFILEYFGTPKDGTCGHCMNCEGRSDNREEKKRAILIKKQKEIIE
ncbi:MAG: ATP-dependent DNA helicase [Treponema sp.]|nr:ATP-dependent DNA helicase [Treponema sp.]